MKFSELISQEEYKPRPREGVADRDAAIQRLTLVAYKHFEEGVQKRELTLLPERSYINQSELIEAAGGTWQGVRDSVLEDFNLDMQQSKTVEFIDSFFDSKRSYGLPKAPRTKPGNIANQKLRDEARDALTALYGLTDKDSKAEMLEAVEEVKRSFGAYADVVRPLKGLLPEE